MAFHVFVGFVLNFLSLSRSVMMALTDNVGNFCRFISSCASIPHPTGVRNNDRVLGRLRTAKTMVNLPVVKIVVNIGIYAIVAASLMGSISSISRHFYWSRYSNSYFSYRFPFSCASLPNASFSPLRRSTSIFVCVRLQRR